MNAPVRTIEPDINAAMAEARRMVATARLAEFENQCFCFGGLVRRDEELRHRALDFLYDLALANGLLRIHGGELIESMIAAGIRGDA